MNQSVPPEIEEKIINLKGQFYSKGSIVRAIKKQAGSKEKALEYISIVTKDVKQQEIDNPEILRSKAKKEFGIGIGAILGGVALAIVWSAGFVLFLGGIFYIFIALYHELEYRKKKR